MAYERCWQGSIHSVNDSQGMNGAIAFGEDRSHFVAAFFMAQSDRSPFLKAGHQEDEGSKLRQKIPLVLHRLIDMVLPLLTLDVKGVSTPVVSSVFWSGLHNGHSTSSESWEDVFSHGASLIHRELQSEQDELGAFAEDMNMG